MITAEKARKISNRSVAEVAIVSAAIQGYFSVKVTFLNLSDARTAKSNFESNGFTVSRIKEDYDRDGILYLVTISW